MSSVHLLIGVGTIAVLAATALLGGWCWLRRRPSRAFWWLLRGGQAMLVAQAALGGLLLAGGGRAGDLHLLYGLLPLFVQFAGEGLRATSAVTVLQARGLQDAQAVGRLPEAEQHDVMDGILRRELGTMAVACAVCVALALRAYGLGR